MPQSGPNFSLRPKAALLKQARPSAEYFAPRARDEGTHTPCGGRSAPPSLFYKKRRCRLAVPEKNRRGSGCSLPHLKHERHPRHPHQAGRRFHRASGTEEYNPSAHFVGTSLYTREALAGHFTILCGGPGGVFHLPVGHSSSRPLALFSWTARRPVLFSRGKENGGAESASPWGRKNAPFRAQRKVWPRCARNPSSPPAAGTPGFFRKKPLLIRRSDPLDRKA